MNKTSFWTSANFWTMVATSILGIFALGGANIDAAATGGKLVSAIWSGSAFSIGTIVVLNVINPIYQWSKKKMTPQTRWAFLHSLNWWGNFSSLILSIPVAYGLYDESIYGIVPDVIKAIAERNWYQILSLVGINLVIPIVKIFVNKPISASNLRSV